MALLRRRSDETGVSQVEFNQPSERRWPLLLAYLLAAVLVALILVFGGRWVYRKVTNNEPAPAPNPVQPAGTNLPAQPDTSRESGGSSPSPSPTPTPSTPSSPNPGTNQNPTPPSGQLPNNGPGDVIALFVGTSLAAAALHYIVSLRRSALRS